MEGTKQISREEFARLYPKLVARLRGLGASAEEVEDLVQEVFVRVHRSLGNFKGWSELDTWVISIAKRVWLNDRRRKRAEKRQAEEVSLDERVDSVERSRRAVDIEDQLLDRDLLSQVGQAMHRLPETMRKALVMHCNGYKYREISRHLEVSESRVASLIHQARTKLRQRFTA